MSRNNELGLAALLIRDETDTKKKDLILLEQVSAIIKKDERRFRRKFEAQNGGGGGGGRRGRGGGSNSGGGGDFLKEYSEINVLTTLSQAQAFYQTAGMGIPANLLSTNPYTIQSTYGANEAAILKWTANTVQQLAQWDYNVSAAERQEVLLSFLDNGLNVRGGVFGGGLGILLLFGGGSLFGGSLGGTALTTPPRF